MNTDLNSLKEQAEMLNKYLDENFDDETFQMILDETGLDIKQLEDEMTSYVPRLNLKYKKLHPDAVEPNYNYPSDSGFDLYATETVYLPMFGRALVPTGLSFDIKDGGTVDNGYTGEIKVIIFNSNNFAYTIEKGTKVGQAVLCPVVNGKWIELEETMEEIKKDRNENGFGSTGI